MKSGSQGGLRRKHPAATPLPGTGQVKLLAEACLSKSDAVISGVEEGLKPSLEDYSRNLLARYYQMSRCIIGYLEPSKQSKPWQQDCKRMTLKSGNRWEKQF